MPAQTFVLIFKCVARPNLCETPALAKPPPRCTSVVDRAVYFGETEKRKKYMSFIVEKKSCFCEYKQEKIVSLQKN
jgi:hypothetical protein